MKRNNKVTKISRMILLGFAAATSCGGIVYCVIKSFASDTNFSGDAWLGFWGSIIGSIVTILGIALTLSYENKQINNTRRLEAQPIITLNALDLNSVHSENECSYHLSTSGHSDKELHFSLPDIEIRNIGLNFATNIELHFFFETPFSGGSSPLTILDAKETKQISLYLDINKDEIPKYLNNLYIRQEGKMMHACWALTMTLLARANKKECIDKIRKIYYESGKIVTTFEDIYGNVYMQERNATIYLVELCNEEYFAYISFPKFTTAILCD